MSQLALAIFCLGLGLILATQLKPWNVGDERIFSPNFWRNAARMVALSSPAAMRSAISFLIGSPELHWRWLHAWTVRPHPH